MFILKSCHGLHVQQQEKHVETSCIIPYYIRKRTTVDFTSESQSLLFIVRRRGDRGTRVILSRALPYNGRTVRIFSFLSPPYGIIDPIYIYMMYTSPSLVSYIIMSYAMVIGPLFYSCDQLQIFKTTRFSMIFSC